MIDKKKYAEVFLNTLEQLVNRERKEYTEEEKERAAYALNLCTVSVSQIVNYNDINILEQEYDTVLNNLNLEKMPKDEALLNIIKQILDTVTFFRISEGERQFIDREYQHKLQNALWSAVPQFGLLVAGGNWKTMAVSLATQVGIGYMNYRNIKAEAAFDRERARWRLDRSAIEQLNGLRRELFDAAWRLAEEYQFPDEYRLTEIQIEQYNRILMDNNLVRKYERLDSIKDKFKQYAPFWYQFGNTAAKISQTKSFTEVTRNKYKDYACKHYETFFKLNDKNMLRIDQIAAACALEYIDLLDCAKDAKRIDELLEIAAQNSEGMMDIMQLCAMAYLKKGDMTNASLILRRLVNEDYNIILNAQILSNIYVSDYAYKKNADAAYSNYELLTTRMVPDYLYPFPYDGVYDIVKMERNFYEKQQQLLESRYHIALNEFIEKYTIKYNRLFQTPDKAKDYSDTYFLDNAVMRQRRLNELQDVLANNRKKKRFYMNLSDDMVIDTFFDILNEIYAAVEESSFIINGEMLELTLNSNIALKKEYMQNIANLTNLSEEEQGKVRKFLLEITFRDFVYDFFKELNEQIMVSVKKCNDMGELAKLETRLRDFCIAQGLSDPAKKYERKYKARAEGKSNEKISCRKIFSHRLLGLEYETQERANTLKKRLIKISEGYEGNIVKPNEKAMFLLAGNSDFENYFNRKIRDDTIAKKEESTIVVIDDTRSIMDNDLLITTEGLITTSNGKFSGFIPYDSVRYRNDKESLEGEGYDKISSEKIIDIEKLPPFMQTILENATSPLSLIATPIPTIVWKKILRRTLVKYSNKGIRMNEVYDMIKQFMLEIDKIKPQAEECYIDAADEYSFLDTGL